DRSLEVVPDARRGVEEDDAVPRRQEGGLVDAIRDPVQVPLDASHVVALLVGSRAEGGRRDGGVIGQGLGRLALDRGSTHRPSPSMLVPETMSSGARHHAQGSFTPPDWLRIAAKSSKAHCSLIFPASSIR